MGKGKNRADRGDPLMLCANADDCARKRIHGAGSGMGKESIVGCEVRKVKGGNYMKSYKYNAKKLEFYISSRFRF